MLTNHRILPTVIIYLFCFVKNVPANHPERRLYSSGHESQGTPGDADTATSELSTGTSKENYLQESRGWKKTALPFLLGITLKMTTLLPMISSLMAVVGGVALVASKLALAISVGLAVHYYLTTKHQTQFYRQPLQPLAHSPVSVYDPLLPAATSYPVSHRLSVQAS